MRKFLAAVVALCAVAAIAFYIASPWLAFYQLQQAARAGDRDALEAAVDFPAVREDFKAQLNAAFLTNIESNGHLKDNPLAALGALIVPAVLDRLIDAYVTPQGIATMVAEARTPKPGSPAPVHHGGGHVTAHSEYVSLDRFKTTMTSKDEPGRPLVFVMERRGLFGWKLVRIELPLDGLKR
jgi:hypothetical protein